MRRTIARRSVDDRGVVKICNQIHQVGGRVVSVTYGKVPEDPEPMFHVFATLEDDALEELVKLEDR